MSLIRINELQVITYLIIIHYKNYVYMYAVIYKKCSGRSKIRSAIQQRCISMKFSRFLKSSPQPLLVTEAFGFFCSMTTARGSSEAWRFLSLGLGAWAVKVSSYVSTTMMMRVIQDPQYLALEFFLFSLRSGAL